MVSDLQLEIKSVGYDPGQVTGTFTGATQRALTAFQKAVGVSSIEDGTLGPQTATSLQSRLGGTSRAVRALQNSLAEVGLFHGTANGVYGSETFAAVQALQRLTHLRVDGLFGPASAVGLGVLYRGHQGGPPTPSTTAKKVAGIAGSAFRPEEQTT